ncbi:MAG: hypothetical protein DRP09_19545, partial [Candidatus Thorarchaeota archaeon]
MKTKIITMIAVVVFYPSQELKATDIDFYDDGIIQEGDGYDNVNVHNVAIVDMTGGVVSDFFTNDSSTANLTDGEIWRFYCRDTSTFNMFGGIIHQSFGVSGNGIANLHAGSIGQGLSAIESSEINVYGYDFSLIPSGSNYFLSGFWGNDDPFTLYLRGPETYPRVVLHEIPEPHSFAFLFLGSSLIIR